MNRDLLIMAVVAALAIGGALFLLHMVRRQKKGKEQQ